MLEHCFRRRRLIARLRAGPFGEMLEEFVAYLHDRGHPYRVLRGYVRAADCFTRWLALRGLLLNAVDERLVQSFLCGSGRRLSRGRSVPSLRHFLSLLRLKGLAPPPSTKLPLNALDKLLAEYDEYLRDVVGLAAATRRSRMHYAREFLSGVFGNGAIRVERLRPVNVHSFVAGFGRAGRLASVPVAASALRRLIRWLQLQGRCSASLVLAVPSFRTYRHASLPKVMTDHQIRAFLATFDRSTPVGRRDFAMALVNSISGSVVSKSSP